MYKLEFKLSFPLMLTSFPLVLLFLLFVAGGYEFYQDLKSINLNHNVAQASDEKVFKVDMQSSLALSNQQQIKGLGVDSAEMYILKVEKKKSGLSSLFSKLKNKKSTDALKIVKNKDQVGTSKSLPNYNAFLSQSEKMAINDKSIKKLIHSKKHLFRGCYNRMLLKDGLLSGIATVTISSNGKGSSVFKGVGRTKVINELKGCLNTQVEKINLSSVNLTKAIRFSLNFSS